MLRQSSGRNYRSKKLRPTRTFQAVLFFAFGVWIVYQLSRSHAKRRAVVVEVTGDGDGAVRRRLGRKGFAGHASSDDGDVVGVGSGDGVGNQGAATSSDDDDEPLSKTEDGDSDEEDRAADEDGGGADDAEDGIAGDEEEDDGRDLLLSGSSDGEDELKTLFGDGEDGARLVHDPKVLNSTAVPRAKAASLQTNASGDVANGKAGVMATALGDSSLKNVSAVSLSLHDSDKGSVGHAANKLVGKGFVAGVAGAENERHNVSGEGNRVINQNEAADSLAGHSISS